jgi:hypothetical protein
LSTAISGGNSKLFGGGTRLTLWHSIDNRFISWGAAGWHICFDVLDHLLSGTPIGRIAGGDATQFGGWQRLKAEYARQFGIKNQSGRQLYDLLVARAQPFIPRNSRVILIPDDALNLAQFRNLAGLRKLARTTAALLD